MLIPWQAPIFKHLAYLNPALISSSPLQIGTSRHRKLKQLDQSHTASKRVSQDLDTDRLRVCALSYRANLPHKERPGCPLHALATAQREALSPADLLLNSLQSSPENPLPGQFSAAQTPIPSKIRAVSQGSS